ncbi:hypothetical protein WJX73_002834 [Symbiochloris irregularis]|uniref:Protein Mpv17 n=1 Tax=Symbiochloris irregularis TaxID=706552 RepID=A0AAW1P9K5_9CHLO
MHRWSRAASHRHTLPPLRAQTGTAGSGQNRASGPQKLNPLVHAAIVSGSLSVVGDALAQLFSGQGKLDKARSARMGGFGFCLYGPYQSVWYRALDRVFPLKTTQNFLTKVTLNQLLLAPVVLAGVFTWNLALQGQAGALHHASAIDIAW